MGPACMLNPQARGERTSVACAVSDAGCCFLLSGGDRRVDSEMRVTAPAGKRRKEGGKARIT